MNLNISYNNLTGSLDLLSWKNLMFIDIRSNSLQGFLPVPPTYTSLFFASNIKFHGQISSSFCNKPLLLVLDLGYNHLSGNIPRCLGNNSLQFLNVRSNKLHGKIVMNFTENCMLQSINMNDNQFKGKVPRSLRRCKNLQVLDFGRNRFNDTFPHWLGTLEQLQVLVLQSNNFRGPIAYNSKQNKDPFSKLQILDLSKNQFSGKLMRYIENFKAMTVNNDSGHKSSNQYIGNGFNYYYDSIVLTIKGSTVDFERILTVWKTLDVSNNRFTGDIPSSVGELAALIGLNMSQNHLTGRIPPSLTNLSSLEFLDLSCNKLEGEIPQQLKRLTFLEFFNVSENQLVGRIPKGNQFNTFSSSSYKGNMGLCGDPLPKCEIGGSPDHPPMLTQYEENNFIDNIISISLWKIIMIGFGIGTMLGFVAGGCMLFTLKPIWFSRKVDEIEYNIVQSSKKSSRRRQTST